MYTIIWIFQVKLEQEPEFVRVYGSSGDWTELFKQGEGYLGSELLQDRTDPQHYLTIDRWVSVAAYKAFRERWKDEYEALDRCFEQLTERETKIGEFSVVDTELDA